MLVLSRKTSFKEYSWLTPGVSFQSKKTEDKSFLTQPSTPAVGLKKAPIDALITIKSVGAGEFSIIEIKKNM